MARIVAFLYGVVAYVLFFVTFLYAIGFVGNVVVPKSIDSPRANTSFAEALVVDAVLLAIFALQHSIMARPGFKQWWTRIMPQPVERSTYVVLASLALDLLFWQWRPMLKVIWSVENPIGAYVLSGFFWLGWTMVLVSTFLINHFDLFGLRQVYLYQRGQAYKPVEFQLKLLYKIVRHPLMLGFIIAFWATPRMTFGHLVFAIATTAYILIAIQIEERDLKNLHGQTYEDYRHRVSMLLPIPKRAK